MSKGIVFLAGGRTYFVNAYANIKILREMGCFLPIEWFYMGDEMRPEWIEAIKNLTNVKLIKLAGKSENKRQNGGWQTKVKSIIKSSFDEVLYLDSDSFCHRDPTYLFDNKKYKEIGAVMWKDECIWNEFHIKRLNGYFKTTPKPDDFQVESGQLMFDKSKCMDALLKTEEYNDDSEVVYKLIYGDKDTFYFGFKDTNTPFIFAPKQPIFEAGSLLHYDFDGEKLFSHLVKAKWSFNGRSLLPHGIYPHSNRCSQIIRDLVDDLIRIKYENN